MSKYAVALNGVSYDLASNTPLPVDDLNNGALVDVYNRVAAVAATIPDFDPKKVTPVAKFASKDIGVKRIAALHSSVVAFVGGQATEKNRGKEPKATREQRTHAAVAKAQAKVGEVKKTTKTPAPATNGTGRRGRAPTFHLKTIHLGSVALAPRAKRFATYKDGMTVEQYLAEAGKQGRTEALAIGDIRYDATRGVISLRD